MRRAQTKEQFENRNKLNSLFLKTAGTFAENLLAIYPAEKEVTNVFGRTVCVSTESSLYYLQGLAVSGIRCAAFVAGKNIDQHLAAIKSMASQNVPMTIAVEKGALPKLPELAQTGAIVFQSFSAQEWADRILFAQVLAEKALLPVVVLAAFDDASAETASVAKRDLINFFGDPDNFTNIKSPAQSIVFGNKRKRVPHWLNTDLPVNIGAQKDQKALAFEWASKEKFTYENLQTIIDETAVELEAFSKRKLTSYKVFGNKKPKRLLLTTSSVSNETVAGKDVEKFNLAFYQLEQLYPLPNFNLEEFKKAISVTVIESFFGTQSGWIFKEVSANAAVENAFKSNGWYANELNTEDWTHIIENAILDKKGRKHFWIDVPFDVDKSKFPKHQVLVQHISRDYPELNAKSLRKAVGNAAAQPISVQPVQVKKYAEKGPAFTRVSRFFDDTACFYNTGSDELIADPFQSIPIMPVSTASFMPMNRGWAPEFLPQKAKDIESLIKACPHGAMPTSLLTLEAVIKAGIQQARNNGNAIGALVPQLKVWSKKAGEIALNDLKSVKVAGDILPEAFAQTLIQAKADGDKKATLEQEYAWTMEGISELPISLTEEYFVKAEKAKPGTGEVFTLGIDPSSCTGCGSCAELCTDGAITMNTELDYIENLNKVRFNQFAPMPSTADATVKKLIADKNFDSFAALMLNRDLYASVAGGSLNDDLTAEKSIIRMISALANQTLSGNASEIEKLLSKQTAALNNAVKKILSDSLPVTHLDSLMEVLHESREEKLSMDRIMKEWGQQDAFKVVEKESLQSKLELIEALKEWKWALKEGFTGVGRANYNLVIDHSLAEFSKYPWNNFTVPVINAEKGETAATALGIFEGQLRHAIDQIKLLRRTDLEAINKYDPSIHNFQIAGLNWEQLTDEEKKIVPPVLILATHKIYADFASSGLNELLEKGYPIKLYVLDNLNMAPEKGAAEIAASANAFWPLLASGSAYLSRVSLAEVNHMFTECEKSLNTLSGSVISILCPNTFSHNINPQRWRSLSTLAVNARAFNPFSFDPLGGTTSFGSKFNTSILPNVADNWITAELKYEEDDEEKSITYKPTWADWAFTLNSWNAQFKLLANKANAVPVADFLALSPEDRAKKIPVVLRVDDENKLIRYEVGTLAIAAADVVYRNFLLLREMAGLYSEFPEQLKEKVTQELSGQFEVEKKKLTAELAKEKAEWENKHMAEIKEQMKARLMELAQQAL